VDPEVKVRHREFFGKVPVEGVFMIMAKYPYGGVWDFKIEGERKEKEQKV
jgi:hypothetical protein